MDTFRPFSWIHILTVAVVFGLTLLAVAVRRRRDPEAPASAWERRFAFFNLIAWSAVNGWWLLPGNFDPSHALPIQMCDLTWLMVAVALVLRWRPARAILYFWGIALSSQGILTPDLQEGPARIVFWLFWIAHGAIVGSAVYDLAARRYRPGWKDFRYAYGAAWIYFLLILPFDIAYGYNYGYVGNARPDRPTLVDVLGPWPQRLVWIILLVSVAMLVLLLPWELGRFLKRRRPAPAEPA